MESGRSSSRKLAHLIDVFTCHPSRSHCLYIVHNCSFVPFLGVGIQERISVGLAVTQKKVGRIHSNRIILSYMICYAVLEGRRGGGEGGGQTDIQRGSGRQADLVNRLCMLNS